MKRYVNRRLVPLMMALYLVVPMSHAVRAQGDLTLDSPTLSSDTLRVTLDTNQLQVDQENLASMNRFSTIAAPLIELIPTRRVPKAPIATLIQNEIGLADSEQQATWWFYMPWSGWLTLATDALDLSIHDVSGKPIQTAVVQENDPLPGMTTVYFETPVEGRVFVVGARRGAVDLRNIQVGLSFDPEAFHQAVFAGLFIDSPRLNINTGEPVFEVDGLSGGTLSMNTDRSSDLLFNSPMSFLDYYMQAELSPVYCMPPLINSQLTPFIGGKLGLYETFFPPAGTSGPSAAPLGSSHDKNFCGISVFIHSMETTFPGSLPADVRTNARSWDKVGDRLDHSNTFGQRGGKLVDNVNKNYGEKIVANDGNAYCAGQISDTSTANLAAWAADCDLKLLIYAPPAFGHWVDVDGVNTTTGELTLQDYGDNYKATYDGSNETVDFRGGTGGPMASEFTGSNTVAGDDLFESVNFYVVCKCEVALSGGKVTRGLPTTTASGKSLKP